MPFLSRHHDRTNEVRDVLRAAARAAEPSVEHLMDDHLTLALAQAAADRGQSTDSGARRRGRRRRASGRLAVIVPALVLAATTGLAWAHELPSPVQRLVAGAQELVDQDGPRGHHGHHRHHHRHNDHQRTAAAAPTWLWHPTRPSRARALARHRSRIAQIRQRLYPHHHWFSRPAGLHGSGATTWTRHWTPFAGIRLLSGAAHRHSAPHGKPAHKPGSRHGAARRHHRR
jgi:hypothetical protein